MHYSVDYKNWLAISLCDLEIIIKTLKCEEGIQKYSRQKKIRKYYVLWKKGEEKIFLLY